MENQPIQPAPSTIPNQEPISAQTPVQIPQPPKNLLKETWEKIRSNKKLFWLLISLFSVIALIIIAGTIYKLAMGSGTKEKTIVQSPTPQATAQETEAKPLDLVQKEIDSLKSSVNDFDINQRRLTPPTLDFKISF